MPKKQKGERPGKGAVCTVITRFIHPKQNNPNKQHRSSVVLTDRVVKLVNRKEQQCFTFTIDGGNGEECFAIERYCKVVKEGPKKDFFDPLLEDDDFKEPSIKWKKSKAKEILTEMIIQGDIPEDPDDPTPVDDIYILHPEFCKYDRSKFPGRLNLKIKDMWSRADDDFKAFENYIANHEPSLYSHKGYAEWQGSDAQMFLLMDLEAYEKDPNNSNKVVRKETSCFKHSLVSC